METSVLLAKLMGPLLLLLGLYVVFLPDRLARIGREYLASEALMFTAGLLALTAGLAIVVGHNVWVMDWPVLITIFGWIAVGAGLARLLLGTGMKRMGEEMLANRVLTAVPGGVMALLGAILSYFGFIA